MQKKFAFFYFFLAFCAIIYEYREVLLDFFSERLSSQDIEDCDDENLTDEFDSLSRNESSDDAPTQIPSQTQKENFIYAVQSSEELNERFENIRPLNICYDREGTLVQEGSTSIVFLANDATDGRRLALKVCDAENAEKKNANEIATLFQWESGVLGQLKNVHNCQQLRTPCNHTFLETSHGRQSVPYISTIYLPADLKRNFYRNDSPNEALTRKKMARRLKVFIQMISAIQVLHRHGICHRDIRPENFRGYTENHKAHAVAIDLGMSLANKSIEDAIRLYSPCAHGALAYAAPEKLCGFCDDFEMGLASDIFSLGCLLYETVSKDLFYNQFLEMNASWYHQVISDSTVYKTDGDSLEERLRVFDGYIEQNFSKLLIPQLDFFLKGKDHAKKEIQSLIDFMCAFDYKRRAKDSDLPRIKDKLRSVIKELEQNARKKKNA